MNLRSGRTLTFGMDPNQQIPQTTPGSGSNLGGGGNSGSSTLPSSSSVGTNQQVTPGSGSSLGGGGSSGSSILLPSLPVPSLGDLSTGGGSGSSLPPMSAVIPGLGDSSGSGNLGGSQLFPMQNSGSSIMPSTAQNSGSSTISSFPPQNSGSSTSVSSSSTSSHASTFSNPGDVMMMMFQTMMEDRRREAEERRREMEAQRQFMTQMLEKISNNPGREVVEASSLVSTTATERPVKRKGRVAKPEKYNGMQTKKLAIHWLYDIETYLESELIEEEGQKIATAGSFLEGTAKQWFLSQTSNLETFEQFTHEFLKMFRQQLDEDKALSELAALKQGNMAMKDYILKFDSIIFRIMPSNISEREKYRYLVNGLEPRYKSKVLGERFSEDQQTLTVLKDFLIMKEAVYQTKQNIEKGANAPKAKQPNMQEKRRSFLERTREDSFSPKKEKQNKKLSGRDTDKCWRCGGVGHLSRDCSSPKKEVSTATSTTTPTTTTFKAAPTTNFPPSTPKATAKQSQPTVRSQKEEDDLSPSVRAIAVEVLKDFENLQPAEEERIAATTISTKSNEVNEASHATERTKIGDAKRIREFLLEGKMDGERMCVFIDNGSTNSFIHPKAAEKLGISLDSTSSSNIVFGNPELGFRGKLHGKVKKRIDLGEYSKTLEFLIAECPYDVTLGWDWYS